MMTNLMLVSANTYAEKIEVFTTSAHPVALNGLTATVCELDGLSKLSAVLNRNGSQINAIDTHLQAQLVEYYRCQLKANQYSIQYLPAIVIDKAYVAYGLNQVDKALIRSRYERKVNHG